MRIITLFHIQMKIDANVGKKKVPTKKTDTALLDAIK